MGKKMFFISSMVFAAGCLMAACGNKADAAQIEFDSLKIDRRQSLGNNDSLPECLVQMEIVYAKKTDTAGQDSIAEDAADSINSCIVETLFKMERLSVKAAADSFANTYLRNYINDLGEMYKADAGDPSRMQAYQYSHDIKTSVRKGLGGCIIYEIQQYDYEGGAHGMTQTIVRNFDSRTGKVISLDDVFVPGYTSRLNSILLTKLMDYAKAKSMEELNDMGYLYDMDIFTPSNYILDTNGIEFIYNQYEIAPYALGQIRLKAGYGELSELMRKQ